MVIHNIEDFLEDINNLKSANLIDNTFKVSLYDKESDTYYPMASIIIDSNNKEVRLGPLFEETLILEEE